MPRTESKEHAMVAVTRYDPFGELVDDFFKGFFVRPVPGNGREAIARLKVDVTEQDGAFKVLAELPGVKKDDIQVTIDGDQVAISAEVKQEKERKEGERVVHGERYFGRVSRAFRLGYEIDESKVQAKYADGVLELVLPKKPTAQAQRITIQ
jgi:HSP20 family protein